MIRFLAFKSFRNRKFTSFLCVLSIALSLSLFLMVEKLRVGIEEGFTNSISNADLIVGARSGPLQLLLYTIFHMDSPTNNISIESYNAIKGHPAVDWTVPISLGDSYKGYRVVATNTNFLAHYRFGRGKKISLREGVWKDHVFGVVLGDKVYRELKHQLGDSIILSHGLSEESFLHHDQTPFKVTGILNPTGTPVDKSVYISLYGMEAIHATHEGEGEHEGEDEHAGEDEHDSDHKINLDKFSKENLKNDQITSFILRTKNRTALLGLQRFISTYQGEPLSAIIPAVTLTQLWEMLDQLERAFKGVSFFVVVMGFLTILIILYMSLEQRHREIAILRSVGVSAGKITLLLVTEAVLLSCMGAILGLFLQYVFLFFVSPLLEFQYAIHISMAWPSRQEIFVLCWGVALGSLFGLVPAFKAYRTSLTNGL